MKSKFVQDLRPYHTAPIVSKDMAIRRMVQVVVEHPECHFLCVVDQGDHLLGLIDRKQLFRAIFTHHVSASSMVKQLFTLLTSEQASDLIVKDVLTCRGTDSLDDLIKLIIEHHLDAVPVVSEEGRLEGIITFERIFREWLKQENS